MKITGSRIGIYAPNGDGHRFKYVQYLLTHLPAGVGEVVLLTTPESLRSNNFTLHLASSEDRFAVHLMDSDRIGDLVALSRSLHTDLMVLPDGDSFAWKHAWRKGWKGAGEVSALVMRASGQRGGPLRKAADRRIKRMFFALGNSRHHIHLTRLESALWDPVTSEHGVADPITYEPDEAALDVLCPPGTMSQELRWVGLVGALDRRKNVPLVLEAALHVRRGGFGIVLAGRTDASITEDVDSWVARLREHGIPVLVIRQLLTDGQLDALIGRLQCVVLAHSNEGPSGILGKAARAGTFVAAAGANSLQQDCRSMPMSSRWSPLTVEGLALSIEEGLSCQSLQSRSVGSAETFARRLLQGIFDESGTSSDNGQELPVRTPPR
ncbi:glycosyltransferase [Kocuria rosea]|uniref:glycosyltransferase n=1 Tax=Kocuria rosea TaxID=1275 RepID=UPI000F700796|nr:glycosyltransferase [Kocuria rosea]VEI50350.1 Uncharacterised protein [Kocuria rosea]